MDPITAGQTVAGALTMANQVRETLAKASAYTGNTSLIDVTAVARVEPLLMVDASVMNLEYLPDVVQSLQSLFSGYYLQAIDVLTNIGGIKVSQRLGPLNPNRPAEIGLLSQDADWRLGMEAYEHRLPTRKNPIAMALESTKITVGRDASKTLVETSNLSVGKLYDITIKENDKTATLKIAIRVMANSIPTSTMVSMFSLKNAIDMDLKERYHGWRAGRLSFIKDLVLCQDLIEKHRTSLIKDKSGIYNEIVNRQNKGLFAGLLTKNPSLAIASNLAIISADTALQIEAKMLGKFSSFKTRQMIFDNTNLMILAVVDPAWERVTFYHRGIGTFSEMSIKDIRNSNKGSGPEVTDILKAFMAGSAPSL